MTEITADIASQALSSEGYSFSRIEQIHEGSNHYIFRVYLSNGDIAICKFAKSRVTELGIVPPQTDTLFGGALSLCWYSACCLGSGASLRRNNFANHHHLMSDDEID